MEACKVEPVIAPVATTYKEIREGREKDTVRVSFQLLTASPGELHLLKATPERSTGLAQAVSKDVWGLVAMSLAGSESK